MVKPDTERLDRIESILKANMMHEPTCAIFGFLKESREKIKKKDGVDPPSPVLERSLPKCDCWLVEVE